MYKTHTKNNFDFINSKNLGVNGNEAAQKVVESNEINATNLLFFSFSTEPVMKYARIAMFSLQMTFTQRPSKSKGAHSR